MSILFIHSDLQTPKGNMEMDEDLALHYYEIQQQLDENEECVIVRLYRWKPECISLGFHQKNEFDEERMKQDGVELITRPTGGRAVYHSVSDLTYAVILLAKENNAFYFHKINQAIEQGLKTLGIETSFERGSLPTERFEKQAAICYQATSRYELLLNGKKIVGSAQRRYRDVLLQHGTISLETNQSILNRYIMNTHSDANQSVSDVEHNSCKTTSISNELAKSFEINRVVECVKDGFVEIFNTTVKTIGHHDINKYSMKNKINSKIKTNEIVEV